MLREFLGFFCQNTPDDTASIDATHIESHSISQSSALLQELSPEGILCDKDLIENVARGNRLHTAVLVGGIPEIWHL